MSVRDDVQAIRNAYDFYKEHREELKPAIEAAECFLKDLRRGREIEAAEIVSRFKLVAEAREARAGVEKEIADKQALSNGIAALGAFLKLAAMAL